ncbi:MAG: hypothetical protein EBQ80_01805 [Proteobacteria bacterium]|nr:hypothetical protein [Pseudomonadota bacterium]
MGPDGTHEDWQICEPEHLGAISDYVKARYQELNCQPPKIIVFKPKTAKPENTFCGLVSHRQNGKIVKQFIIFNHRHIEKLSEEALVALAGHEVSHLGDTWLEKRHASYLNFMGLIVSIDPDLDVPTQEKIHKSQKVVHPTEIRADFNGACAANSPQAMIEVILTDNEIVEEFGPTSPSLAHPSTEERIDALNQLQAFLENHPDIPIKEAAQIVLLKIIDEKYTPEKDINTRKSIVSR